MATAKNQPELKYSLNYYWGTLSITVIIIGNEISDSSSNPGLSSLHFTLCCIAVIHIQLYPYTCGNIVNTIMTNKHTSLEKYTSHTLFEMVVKGLCVRGELETGQTATYWPLVPLSLAALLSHSAGLLNRGSWGPITLCWVLVLTTASYLQLTDSQLTEPVCGPRLYNCLMSTCFLWASHLHPIQPVHNQGYTLISSTGCTCSSIDGWVEGQYVTLVLMFLGKVWIHLFSLQLWGNCRVALVI